MNVYKCNVFSVRKREQAYGSAVHERLQGLELLRSERASQAREAVDVHETRGVEVSAHTVDEAPVPCAPADGVAGAAHRSRPSMMTRIPQDEATSSSSLHPLDSSQAGIM